MSRSCVCGGSNENCRYCGGLGTIPDGLSAALDERTQRLKSGSQTPSRPRCRGNLVPCPKGCGAFLNPGRVERHLNKAHSYELTAFQQTEGAERNPISHSAEPRLEPCPICKIKLRAGRIAKHLDKAHNRTVIRAAIRDDQNIARASVAIAEARKRAGGSHPHLSKVDGSRSASQRLQAPLKNSPDAQTSGRKYGLCPICKAKVRFDRIESHTTKVHKRPVAHSRTREVQSSKDPLRDATTLVAARDQNLDATKLYAHPYREEGRYGSHPSHDGFDDESGPE